MSESKDVTVEMSIPAELDSGDVEGEMVTPGIKNKGSDDELVFNTLDEPVKETIMRDLRAVGIKFLYVLIPRQKKSLLRDWDLWGPLILCTFMAIILQRSDYDASHNDGGPEFAEVFVIVWVGAGIVTLNSKLLGGKLSFLQSVCVLGYCLLPCSMALLLCRFILMFPQTNFLFAFRFAATVIGFSWATFASMKFLGDSQPKHRKALAVYPIFLFYFVISWLIISHTDK